MADHFQTGHNNMNPAQGGLLIAPPGLPDPRFKKTVMLVTRNNKAGSLALCVNRITQYTVKDVLADTGLNLDLNIPLYWGGPVDVTSIWMLHSSEWQLDSTMHINDDWSITSNISMFHHISDLDTPKYFRLMFGQASWAPGQLTAELRGMPPWNPNHSWLLADEITPEWLFEQPEDSLWVNCTEMSGLQAVSHWL